MDLDQLSIGEIFIFQGEPRGVFPFRRTGSFSPAIMLTTLRNRPLILAGHDRRKSPGHRQPGHQDGSGRPGIVLIRRLAASFPRSLRFHRFSGGVQRILIRSVHGKWKKLA